MHPTVRGPQGGRCPICNMALVEAAVGDVEPYALDVTLAPQAVQPHTPVHVTFAVLDPKTGTRVTRFDRVHEKMFHLMIVSRDLRYFLHTHPTLRDDGLLEATIEVPRAGAYQLIGDFVPLGGFPQLVQKSFVTAGFSGRLSEAPVLATDLADKVIDGTRVKLTMPEAVAGREELVTFDLSDEPGGTPVTDLEPYLGAPGHMLLASADLVVVDHSHPVAQLSTVSGPTVVFQVLFPRPGEYRMWAQFQRHGRVMTVPFTVPVSDRR